MSSRNASECCAAHLFVGNLSIIWWTMHWWIGRQLHEELQWGYQFFTGILFHRSNPHESRPWITACDEMINHWTSKKHTSVSNSWVKNSDQIIRYISYMNILITNYLFVLYIFICIWDLYSVIREMYPCLNLYLCHCSFENEPRHTLGPSWSAVRILQFGLEVLSWMSVSLCFKNLQSK